MKTYKLTNLDCANCALNLEQSLKKQNFIDDVSVNFATSSLRVTTTDINRVKKIIRQIEPDINLIIDNDKSQGSKGLLRNILLLSSLSVIYIIGLVFDHQIHGVFRGVIWYLLFILIYVVSGWKVVLTAIRNIFKGKIFDEHFLMTLATTGAIIIQALPEAAGVMLFFKIGEFIEERALSRSRKSISALMDIRPDFARKQSESGYRQVSPESVSIGDTILVKPGERVPLDGVVKKGSSKVDTSALTGESVPRMIKAGDNIHSGMIVLNSSVTIEVIRSYQDSAISRILDLVENEGSKKARTEKFITSFARVYTPFVVVLAALVATVPPFLLKYRHFLRMALQGPCNPGYIVSMCSCYLNSIGLFWWNWCSFQKGHTS